ncbi:MAG: glycosyltransferase [Planctomycetes bacterium]|nr:glycosyltransferase [Planctomycetota bacterium]
MKIVHYLGRMRLEDGGVVRAVLDLCAVLAARDHDVTLLTLDATDVPQQWTAGGDGRPRVVTLQPRAGPWPGLRRCAVHEARQCIATADVVHLHVPWDPVCLPLARLARQSGVPYFISLHGMLDDWCMAQKGLKKRLYLAVAGRRLLEQAKAVHCTAEAEQGQSRKWYTDGRPIVVPLIFDLSEYEHLPGPAVARRKFAWAFPDDNDPVVLFLSRLHPKKRVELLIEAVMQLHDDGLTFTLLIAGTGEPQYEQSLRALVERKQLSARIAFLGFVSGRNKVSLYQASDVFVLPTSQENWGFVLLESLACATPVITTKGVDIWPELQSSGGAVIADETPQAFATALADLILDREKRQRMQQQGRAWVQRSFNLDRVVEQYEQLYECARGDLP